MSAFANGVKFKFVDFLRGVFSRKTAVNGHADAQSATGAPASSPDSSLAAPPNGNGQLLQRHLQIPLQSILAQFPLELRAKVKHPQVGNLAIPVALEKILPQLSTGMVKVTYGEIRQAAPQVFAPGTDCDRVTVILPLAEILSRVNPALLTRRAAQKQVEVPAEIVSPFGAEGQGLIFTVGNPKSAPLAAPQIVAPAPASKPVPVAPGAPTRTPSVIPAPALPEQLFQRATKPAASPVTPVTPPAPPSLSLPKDPLAHVPVARPAKPSAPLAAPAGDTGTLSVALASLAQGWPEALRQEIVQLNLADARLALPVGLIEAALKRGRVVFPWRTLRSWIRPAPLPSVSAHDGAELELPLNVLAPLFLARQKTDGKEQQRVTVDEAIPNLFFGLPKPEPVSLPTPPPTAIKPADTNYYVWDDVAETARVDETEVKRKSPTGTEFVARYATPNEIVSRAAALEGVAGAIIALPDGLMVASRIPPDLNGDTLAAFLPQLFAKVSQVTRELRMGELNNLNFTVGNVPWKIFRVNAIFFAAFGRMGGPLPTGGLAALAAELDHRNHR